MTLFGWMDGSLDVITEWRLVDEPGGIATCLCLIRHFWSIFSFFLNNILYLFSIPFIILALFSPNPYEVPGTVCRWVPPNNGVTG